MKRILISALTAICLTSSLSAEKFELFKYGDFNQWVTRNIPESRVIGGKTKAVYEIAPTQTIEGAKAYSNLGSSPWGTSNVYAKVMGISKTSNAVFPDSRGNGNKCVKLTTIMESCKAAGIINVDVLVSGSIFLGKMLEPISSTSNPYSKMEMGIPFTRRPKALRFDYKVYMPSTNERTYSSGFGKKKTYSGSDKALVYVLLQRRWEDKDGNIYAKRVGTACEQFSKTTPQWVSAHDLTIRYGDISSNKGSNYKELIPEANSYYARNSKGKMVPVKEIGWDDANATPTHIVLMASTGSGTAYIGTLGLTLWIDNMGLVYDN
jgi:hypothetical protein